MINSNDDVKEAIKVTKLRELQQKLKDPNLTDKQTDDICREIFKITGKRYPYPKRTIYVTKAEQEAFDDLMMWISFEIEAQSAAFAEFMEGGKHHEAYYSLMDKIRSLKSHEKIK